MRVTVDRSSRAQGLFRSEIPEKSSCAMLDYPLYVCQCHNPYSELSRLVNFWSVPPGRIEHPGSICNIAQSGVRTFGTITNAILAGNVRRIQGYSGSSPKSRGLCPSGSRATWAMALKVPSQEGPSSDSSGEWASVGRKAGRAVARDLGQPRSLRRNSRFARR